MGPRTCYSIALVLLCFLLVVDFSLTQSCGKRKGVKLRIVNGSEADNGYWPWHVALFHHNGSSSVYACGGTILDQNTVLTAAHCLMTRNGIIARRRLVVQMGRNRLRVASNRAQEHEATALIVHPEYNVNGVQHDIALIKLATNITYSNYIQPICLWNRGEDLNAIVGSWGTVVGFGVDETDNVSDTLLEVRIPVVSHITCIESNREVFATQLTANMFCAGNRDGISACNGDSGGGLFFNYSDVWYIRGVVSFTKPRQHENNCDTKEYTAFTDVAKYLRWIEQHIRGTGDQPVVKENDLNRKIRLLPMSTCGANPYASREESSKPVLLGYPWVGVVVCSNDSNKNYAICQATLISDLYLVSGAHCTIRISESVECLSPSVRLGEYEINTLKDCADVDGEMVCSPPVQTLRIESTIKHQDYKNDHFTNNIALIRLRDRADTSQSNVKPICLPVTSELRSQKSSHYILTTWEYLTGGRGNLLERSIREHIDSTECQNLMKEANLSRKITSRHICIKQLLGPECKSAYAGAPLQLVQQVQGKSRYVLHGMFTLSWQKCIKVFQPDVKEVYTNVASYVDWILENMQE